MSKSEKKSPVKKLIIFGIIIIAISVLAFVPTIYQSLLNKRDLSALFDKYGFSYEVTNEKHALVSCNQCGNVSVVECARNELYKCPVCSSSNGDRYFIDYMFTFSKVTKGEEGEEEMHFEAGTVYVFDSKEVDSACSCLKESISDDMVIVEKGSKVFILHTQPSEDLSKVINKLW